MPPANAPAMKRCFMLRRVLADLLAGGFLVPSIEFALGLSSHVCCAEAEGWACGRICSSRLLDALLTGGDLRAGGPWPFDQNRDEEG